MDMTCIANGHARRWTAALESLGCKVLLVIALIVGAPAAYAAAPDPCSPEVINAQLQALQESAIGKLEAAQSESDLVPTRVVDEESQRLAQGLGPSGVTDLLIGLNTQVAAALASVDPAAAPSDFDTSLGAALDMANPPELMMVQLANGISSQSVFPLQQALDSLRQTSTELHTTVANTSLGTFDCPTTTTTTLDPCVLVPLADAQALLGTTDITGPVTAQPLPGGPPGLLEGSTCEYHTYLTGTHNGLVTVIVGRFNDAPSADDGMKNFEQILSSGGQAPPFSALSGLGDSAVRSSGQLPDITGGGRVVMLIVRRGAIMLEVTAGVLPNVGPADLDTALQQVVEKAISKLAV